MRFFLHLSYSGFNYRGWQRQSNVISVQEIIENRLTSIFKEPVFITGCGRTDAEVNANQYFAHFNREDYWDFDLMFRLNKCLPDDISIHDIIPVDNNHHARYNAKRRSYDYYIHTEKNSFLRKYSTLYTESILDIDKMGEAIEIIKRQKDFRAFCITPESHKSTDCIVYDVKLFTSLDHKKIRFHIECNRFLRGMIRILVGHLFAIGSNKQSLETFESHFISNQTPEKFDVAHPQGLYLSKVEYPYLSIPTKPIFFGDSDDYWEEVV